MFFKRIESLIRNDLLVVDSILLTSVPVCRSTLRRAHPPLEPPAIKLIFSDTTTRALGSTHHESPHQLLFEQAWVGIDFDRIGRSYSPLGLRPVYTTV